MLSPKSLPGGCNNKSVNPNETDPVMTQSRDKLGRPLRGVEAEQSRYPQVPVRIFVEGTQAWVEVGNYLDQGLPFHVHEVCEQRWRCAPVEEQPAWQALAQWGAALTHHARGNAKGARIIAQRAHNNLASAPTIPDYINLDVVHSSLQPLLT